MEEVGRSYGRNRKHERLQGSTGTEIGRDSAGKEVQGLGIGHSHRALNVMDAMFW